MQGMQTLPGPFTLQQRIKKTPPTGPAPSPARRSGARSGPGPAPVRPRSGPGPAPVRAPDRPAAHVPSFFISLSALVRFLVPVLGPRPRLSLLLLLLFLFFLSRNLGGHCTFFKKNFRALPGLPVASILQTKNIKYDIFFL